MPTSDLSGVKLLILDHDGVLTDNAVYVNQHGEEMCRYSRADGLGIERLKALGVSLAVISSETNRIVEARCTKLGLAYSHGATSKLSVLKMFSAWPSPIPLSQVAYLGNDRNDLDCLEAVGHPFVVRDAHVSLQRFPHTRARGGYGAVRELCDMIADAIETERANSVIPVRAFDGWDQDNYDTFLAECG